MINELIDFPKQLMAKDQYGLGNLLNHDWGRKSKAEMEILKRIAGEWFGVEGVLAVDLHHCLDHLDSISDPIKRARMLEASKRAVELYGKPEARGVVYRGTDVEWHGEQVEPGEVIPRFAQELGRRLKGMRITNVPRLPDEQTLKRELYDKAIKMEVAPEVIEFILTNFRDILKDMRYD